MLQHQRRNEELNIPPSGGRRGRGAQLLALLFAQKHASARCFQYHFIPRGDVCALTSSSLMALFCVIGCKTTLFQLPCGSAGGGRAGAFLKRWPSRLGDEGRSREARRQIVACHQRLPSGTFINYSHLFPLSVGSTGQPSAAIVFLKALFFIIDTRFASTQSRAYERGINIIIINARFVCSLVEKMEINAYRGTSFLTRLSKAAHEMMWMP